MNKGKLRIYFGYAAGVGKTYAMLEGAQEARKDGIDVVAGYIEPHERPETSNLLEGLEKLPNKKIVYKGIKLSEFDLDAALKRHPQIVLVDELAHTNAYGSRNKKRFQDVEELLRAGIDVYTTVNVQHIESLNDIVEKITGIRVNERIPDDIFNQADQIELVDIEPVNLLERLNKGKIYKKSQVNYALKHFFTEEKLIALREIALRKTADQVNHSANRKDISKNSAYAKEHVLVCISTSPSAPRVIRAASRLATAFNADFSALYVGNIDEEQAAPEDKMRLRQSLRLAEQLGARISVVYGDNLSKQIVEYAKVSHVSKLVIGKSVEKRFWKRTNIVDVLSQLDSQLDIYVIPNGKSLKETSHHKFYQLTNVRFSVSDLFKTFLILAIVTIVGLAFRQWNFNVSNIITIYILGVLINAVVTKGRIFSFISSVLAVLCFNYFFTEPYFTFEAFNPSYPVTFLIMLAASLITATLIKRVQEQARLSAEKSYRTEILLQTNKELAQSDSEREILDATAHQVEKLLERAIIVYPVANEQLSEPLHVISVKSDQHLIYQESQKEKGVAEWVLYNNKHAGATTNTLSAAKYLYLSIRGKNQVFAVIGIFMAKTPELDAFEKSIVFAILGEAALALEKERLREEQQKIELKMQQEQLRANLLRAISHDLRTPLTSISGHANLLLEASDTLLEEQKKELISYIYDDSMWLINLVENLLSITKLDSDVELKLTTNIIDEVIDETLKHLDRQITQHEFRLELSQEVLAAKMDASLMVQVLVNLLNNAIKYTEIGSTIVLSTRALENQLVVEVSDNGKGISEEDKSKIFDLFYTIQSSQNTVSDSKRGLGLGLSLCKSIILAHHGEIYVKDNQPHGAIIGFRLPLVEVNLTNGK